MGALVPQTEKYVRWVVCDEVVERVQTVSTRSLRKLIRKPSLELQLRQSTVCDIVHKCLCLHAYKIQLHQQVMPTDRHLRAKFVTEMLSCADKNNLFLDIVCFSAMVTFHLCGKVNKHRCHIWEYENPHAVLEHEMDTPKIYVWCGLMKDHVIGPFFFHEATDWNCVPGHDW
jgi:hypothetical protein